MKPALALLGLLLSLVGCSDPQAGVYADPSGRVTTSVGSGVGPMRVGVNSNGRGYVGTRWRWLHLGAGF